MATIKGTVTAVKKPEEKKNTTQPQYTADPSGYTQVVRGGEWKTVKNDLLDSYARQGYSTDTSQFDSTPRTAAEHQERAKQLEAAALAKYGPPRTSGTVVGVSNPQSNTVTTSGAAVTGGQANAQSYIDQLAAARRNQTIAQLDKSKNAALSNLQAEKSQIAPRYYDARNQTAAGSQQSARNFAEFMASRGGTRSGAGAQAELMRQGNLQSNVGSLNRQETAAFDDIARRTTATENAYQSDLAAAEAGLQASRMEALIQQMNADRAYQLQQAGLTGDLNGQRTLAGSQLDWTMNPNNPNNVGQNLDNAYRSIQLQNLPQQLQQQAALIDQQLKAGAIDQQTAEYNYQMLTDPNSPQNQRQNIELQLAQMELQNAPVEQKLRLEQLRKQIAQIGAAPYRSPEQVQLDKVRLEAAQEELAQLRSAAGQSQAADEYYDIINESPYVAPVFESNPSNPFSAPVNTGRVQVTNPTGLEGYILSLGLPDSETMKLYRYYNLPIPQ